MTAAGTRLVAPDRRRRPRRAQSVVLGWCARYTRGLPDAVALERRDELASDLWEQEAANGDAPGLGASILWRAVRGVPADLSWRAERIRALPADERPERGWRWTASGAVVAAALVGAALVAFGGYALIRLLEALARHEFLPQDITMMSAGIGTVGLLCGLVLLLRARTRWIGALWLAASAAPVLWFGTVILLTLSATTQAVFFRLQSYSDSPWTSPEYLAAWGGLAAVVLFFLALAVAWAPSRRIRTEVAR
jgi:hypothetical protein